MTAPDTYEYINSLFKKLEQTIHREGWDQPARIFIVARKRAGALVVSELPVQVGDPPGEFLAFIAARMTDGSEFARTLSARQLQQEPDFYGFAFCAEGWTVDATTLDHAEVTELMREGGKSLKEIPGVTTCRNITMVDVWGRSYIIMRIQGQKPIITKAEFHAGRVLDSLVAMTRAVASNLPADRADLTALLAVHTPTLQEAEEQHLRVNRLWQDTDG